ncbi:MAG: SDR family NAD(P)-dependent oxidoreductase [Chloroflexota bacterium]|nr:SDR family NAD(P)-dependent oxidoreductase [Chloroflexota bacterium]
MLQGKVAIVTGGANGIGRASVLALAKGGADIAIWDIDLPRMVSAAAEAQALGRRVTTSEVDVTQWGQVEAAARGAGETFGRIDILAAVAGGSGTTPTYLSRDEETGRYTYSQEGMRQLWTEEIREEDWDGTLDYNLKAVFLCCKAVIPWMKKQHSGAIVTFSSIGASVGAAHSAFAYAAYAAAKAGVTGLTRHLSRELGPFGIRINCVSPGWVGNERMEVRRQEFQAALEEMKAKGLPVPPDARVWNPLGRPSTTEEQANAVAFLASDAASYISGVTLEVNGGAYVR